MTDPFSGIDFRAVQESDFTIIAIHPLTGEAIRMQYDSNTKTFMLPAHVFDQVETLTFSEAAKELNVSRARVSAAVKNGRLPFKQLPNGSKMILKSDLESYNETKTIGRPRKETTC